MVSSVTRRLEDAIRRADQRSRSRMREARAGAPEIAKAFEPISKAAHEISEHLSSIEGLHITTAADGVTVSLGDLSLWLSYDPRAKTFIGEESAHSWFDGERYAERYEWPDSEQCTEALIRFCAEYARLARALKQSAVKP